MMWTRQGDSSRLCCQSHGCVLAAMDALDLSYTISGMQKVSSWVSAWPVLTCDCKTAAIYKVVLQQILQHCWCASNLQAACPFK